MDPILVKQGEEPPHVVPETIMVFGAHPDDELLSVGGTIIKYTNLGSKVIVVIATGGTGGYTTQEEQNNIAEIRQEETKSVSKALDCEFILLGYNELEVNRDSITKITKLLREKQPQVIFCHHPSDVHRQHRKLAQIVREAVYHTATGQAYGGAGSNYMPLGIYYYESPSCKFQYINEDVFTMVDITSEWEKKMAIFKNAYASQAIMIERVISWADSTSKLRGNEINTNRAEAFIPSTEYVPLKIVLF